MLCTLQVKIWFQNRRTKWKKQENISNAEAAELMKAKNSTSGKASLTKFHYDSRGLIPGRPACLSPVPTRLPRAAAVVSSSPHLQLVHHSTGPSSSPPSTYLSEDKEHDHGQQFGNTSWHHIRPKPDDEHT